MATSGRSVKRLKPPQRLSGVAGCALLAALGCSSGDGDAGPADGATDGGADVAKTVLRVPLYPYIPDAAGDRFEALGRRIEEEFEEAHPDIDLVVNPPCFTGDIYDPATLARGLAGEDAGCAYDVVEIDTIFLGEMVATGAIRPWDRLPDGVSWHPAAVASSTVDDKLYGVPHWMCGHFILSRDASVEGARSMTELAAALEALGTPAPNMAANLVGSWNLPPIYIDAWADTNGPEGVEAAVSSAEYDAATLAALATFASTCESGGENPCVDGTYNLEENFDLPAQRFARGEADALFGFSERLHAVLKSAGGAALELEGKIRISSAPLGAGSAPLLFTDSFVVSARCVGACADAAFEFAEHMSAASTFEWLLASEDAPPEARVPRYLMAASLDAYATPRLSQDPYYQVIDAITRQATGFPNAGLLANKDRMEQDILAALASPP